MHVEQGREGTLLQTRNKADTDSVDSEVHSAAALVLKGLGSKGLTSSCAEDSGAGERRERERGEMVRREREEHLG